MEFVCVDSRFKIWDGKTVYTIEYDISLHHWYVFKDEMTSDALWNRKAKISETKYPDRGHALSVLEEYLETIKEAP